MYGYGGGVDYPYPSPPGTYGRVGKANNEITVWSLEAKRADVLLPVLVKNIYDYTPGYVFIMALQHETILVYQSAGSTPVF